MSTASLQSRGLDPLKINFYVNFVHPTGTYFRFHNLAMGLTRLGHRVTVFAGDLNHRSRPREENRDGVSYQIRPESWLLRIFGSHCDPLTIATRFFKSTEPCDVAHLFQPFPGAAAEWIRAKSRVRFYDWDDLWIGGLVREPLPRQRDTWMQLLVGRLEHHLLPRHADHVTAISHFLVEMARERGARSPTLLNSGSWESDPPDRITVRQKLGLVPEALYAGFMGRTDAELPWCFDALAANLERSPHLRLAICGPPESCLEGLSGAVRSRVDYLGQLSPEDSKDFAASMDLSLLPLEDNSFNQSRLPQKFGDYLAARVPLLCSTVGECGRLIGLFPWAMPAGTTREDWIRSFGSALTLITSGQVPPYDPETFRKHLSWDGISRKLANAYYAALDERAGRESGPDRSR